MRKVSEYTDRVMMGIQQDLAERGFSPVEQVMVALVLGAGIGSAGVRLAGLLKTDSGADHTVEALLETLALFLNADDPHNSHLPSLYGFKVVRTRRNDGAAHDSEEKSA